MNQDIFYTIALKQLSGSWVWANELVFSDANKKGSGTPLGLRIEIEPDEENTHPSYTHEITLTAKGKRETRIVENASELVIEDFELYSDWLNVNNTQDEFDLLTVTITSTCEGSSVSNQHTVPLYHTAGSGRILHRVRADENYREAVVQNQPIPATIELLVVNVFDSFMLLPPDNSSAIFPELSEQKYRKYLVVFPTMDDTYPFAIRVIGNQFTIVGTITAKLSDYLPEKRLLNIQKNNGIAFGGTSSREAFECFLPAYFYKDIKSEVPLSITHGGTGAQTVDEVWKNLARETLSTPYDFSSGTLQQRVVQMGKLQLILGSIKVANPNTNTMAIPVTFTKVFVTKPFVMVSAWSAQQDQIRATAYARNLGSFTIEFTRSYVGGTTIEFMAIGRGNSYA